MALLSAEFVNSVKTDQVKLVDGLTSLIEIREF